MIEKLQPVLDAGSAIGDLGEIILAERLLVFEAERAMVGRNHLQVIVFEALPQLWRMMLLAQRWREHVLSAIEARSRQLFHRQQQILRAGLGEGRHAAI